jgi:hypothetical protein
VNRTEWQHFQQRWISVVYADRALSHAERLTLTCFGRCTLRPGYVACTQVKLAQLLAYYNKRGEPNVELIRKHLKAGVENKYLIKIEEGWRTHQAVYQLLLPETPSRQRG